MRPIGFSTGSLAKGDYARALEVLGEYDCPVIELSALRENELKPLLRGVTQQQVERYKHVSVHVPSSLRSFSESAVCSMLKSDVPSDWLLVVHPDIISDPAPWRDLGSSLCLENMDARKRCGRSSSELSELFERFPEAKLCLDLGHAKQIDPSMFEAREILRVHGDRLAQVHLSEVNSASTHERLNQGAIHAFQEVAALVPEYVPIVLESPVSEDEIALEIKLARKALPLPHIEAKLPALPEPEDNNAVGRGAFEEVLSALFTKMGYSDVLMWSDHGALSMWKPGAFGRRESFLVCVKTSKQGTHDHILSTLTSRQVQKEWDSLIIVCAGRLDAHLVDNFQQCDPAVGWSSDREVKVIDSRSLADLLRRHFSEKMAKPWIQWIESSLVDALGSR